MRFRKEVFPFLAVSVAIALMMFGLLLLVFPQGVAGTASVSLLFILSGYLLWFFRNPVRVPPADAEVILSGADGVVAKITAFTPEQFVSIGMLAGLKPEDTAGLREGTVLRISIFLSLFDVHVNRSPISGQSRFLGYFPGKHLFTFTEKSSDVNQHNSILIENRRTCCLVNQIVGPVCRRVIYWLDHDRAVDIKAGDDFGMMKFGSRMDIYFPAADIELVAKEGARVAAGVSVIGRYR